MPSVDDGEYFKLINQKTNKCAANPQGNVIDQRGCNNNDNQLFEFDECKEEKKPVVISHREISTKPQSIGQVPLNTRLFIKNKQTGRCLTAEISQGKRYHLAECNPNNNNQKFTIKPYKGDLNRIFAHNPALVFDLAGQGAHDGNHYWNWPINDTPAQNFKMPAIGDYFKLINEKTGKCAANPQGDVIDQRGCNNNDNQLFDFHDCEDENMTVVKSEVKRTSTQFKLYTKVPLDTVVSIRNKKTGRCLTAEISQGKRYQLAECNPNNNNQKFTIKQYQGDFWRIFAHGNAHVFDLAGQGQHDGNYYHNWPVNSTPAQHFKMPISNGFFKMINQRSNKCAANPQGDVIDQRGCNDSDNQLFFIAQ